jgi:hypothetical protein
MNAAFGRREDKAERLLSEFQTAHATSFEVGWMVRLVCVPGAGDAGTKVGKRGKLAIGRVT